MWSGWPDAYRTFWLDPKGWGTEKMLAFEGAVQVEFGGSGGAGVARRQAAVERDRVREVGAPGQLSDVADASDGAYTAGEVPR